MGKLRPSPGAQLPDLPSAAPTGVPPRASMGTRLPVPHTDCAEPVACPHIGRGPWLRKHRPRESNGKRSVAPSGVEVWGDSCLTGPSRGSLCWPGRTGSQVALVHPAQGLLGTQTSVRPSRWGSGCKGPNQFPRTKKAQSGRRGHTQSSQCTPQGDSHFSPQRRSCCRTGRPHRVVPGLGGRGRGRSGSAAPALPRAPLPAPRRPVVVPWAWALGRAPCLERVPQSREGASRPPRWSLGRPPVALRPTRLEEN